MRAAIIQIENIENNKVFIDETKNVDNYYEKVKRKLNKADFKNKKLQQDWVKLGEESFEFSVLQYLNNNDNFFRSKKHWIEKLESHQTKKGYNSNKELEESWITNVPIEQTIGNFLGRMDKSLNYSDQRLELFNDMDNDVELINYISSNGFRLKQTKTKNSFLCETEQASRALQEIAYYLLFPDFKNEQHEIDFVKDKEGKILNNHGENNLKEDLFVDNENKKQHGYPIISKSKFKKDKKRTLSLYELVRDYTKEKGLDLNEENFDAILNQNQKLNQNNTRENKKKNSFSLNTSYVITDEDLLNYPELQQMNLFKKYIADLLGYGENKENRESILNKTRQKFIQKLSEGADEDLEFTRYIRLLERVYKEVSGEMLLLKEKLLNPIKFKAIGKSSGIFDYDYSSFNFSDPKQISTLMKNYKQLEDRHYHKHNDIWAIINVFDELVKESDFSDQEIFILDEILYDPSIKRVTSNFNTYFNHEFSDQKIRRIGLNYIPKKIANKYLEMKDEFLFYRYYNFLKPNYKKCPNCDEYKLALPRYFSINKDSKDGLHSVCKNCR
jgi:hypothetical protein